MKGLYTIKALLTHLFAYMYIYYLLRFNMQKQI